MQQIRSGRTLQRSFQFAGYVTTVPLALLLLSISWRPVMADLRHTLRLR